MKRREFITLVGGAAVEDNSWQDGQMILLWPYR
jgi:hypothetical protein